MMLRMLESAMCFTVWSILMAVPPNALYTRQIAFGYKNSAARYLAEPFGVLHRCWHRRSRQRAFGFSQT